MTSLGPTNRVPLVRCLALGQPSQRGFTLIEVLIVVVIVAVMAATVAFSINGGDRDRRVKVEVDRLAGLLEMTRNQAIQRNEEWGVYVDEASFSFATFDEQTREWTDYEQRPLRETKLENLRLELYVDNQLELPEQYEDDGVPDLVFFSSGESMKFDLRVEPNWEGPAWTISSDGLSRAEAKREEEF